MIKRASVFPAEPVSMEHMFFVNAVIQNKKRCKDLHKMKESLSVDGQFVNYIKYKYTSLYIKD